MRFLMQAAINMAVFLACALLFPTGFYLDNMLVAAVAAIILAVLNGFIKPVLLILSLPLLVVSLGSFSLIINAAMLEMTALFVPGFGFSSFWWSLVIALMLTLANLVFMDQKNIHIRRQ